MAAGGVRLEGATSARPGEEGFGIARRSAECPEFGTELPRVRNRHPELAGPVSLGRVSNIE